MRNRQSRVVSKMVLVTMSLILVFAAMTVNVLGMPLDADTPEMAETQVDEVAATATMWMPSGPSVSVLQGESIHLGSFIGFGAPTMWSPLGHFGNGSFMCSSGLLTIGINEHARVLTINAHANVWCQFSLSMIHFNTTIHVNIIPRMHMVTIQYQGGPWRTFHVPGSPGPGPVFSLNRWDHIPPWYQQMPPTGPVQWIDLHSRRIYNEGELIWIMGPRVFIPIISHPVIIQYQGAEWRTIYVPAPACHMLGPMPFPMFSLNQWEHVPPWHQQMFTGQWRDLISNNIYHEGQPIWLPGPGPGPGQEPRRFTPIIPFHLIFNYDGGHIHHDWTGVQPVGKLQAPDITDMMFFGMPIGNVPNVNMYLEPQRDGYNLVGWMETSTQQIFTTEELFAQPVFPYQLNWPHPWHREFIAMWENAPCPYRNLARDTEGSIMTASSYVAARPAIRANNGIHEGAATQSWAAVGVNQEWLQVDLGQVRNFNHIRIFQGGNRITDYSLEYSNDGIHWHQLHSGLRIMEQTPAYYEFIHNTTVQARYVRLLSERSIGVLPIVVFEFEVYYLP